MRPHSSHLATVVLAASLLASIGCGSTAASAESTTDASKLPERDTGVALPPHHDAGVASDAARTRKSDAGASIDASAIDAPGGADAPLVIADAGVPAPPQVVDLGGPVMATPKFQLIAYAMDPNVMNVEAFMTEFGSTNEWSTQTAEYGVGAFTVLPPILIPGTPPASLDDQNGNPPPFEQTLVANITGASPVWPAEDGNTIYMFLIPQGTNVVSSGNCCTDFYGYHYEAPLSTPTGAPYGVLCTCASPSGDPLTVLQNVTTTASHEMVESATDPYVVSNVAYGQSDDADAIWTIATGGEIADMCEDNSDSNFAPAGSTYMIQRSWSDMAAKAGGDPCVPVASSAPYFNAYASYDDAITLNYGQPWPTKGVKIAVGKSRTVDVVLKSQGATSGPWTVTAWDMNDFTGMGTPNTTVSLNKTSGNDGDVLELTITVNSYDPNFGGAGVVLESDLGTQDNLTIFAVGQ